MYRWGVSHWFAVVHLMIVHLRMWDGGVVRGGIESGVATSFASMETNASHHIIHYIFIYHHAGALGYSMSIRLAEVKLLLLLTCMEDGVACFLIRSY